VLSKVVLSGIAAAMATIATSVQSHEYWLDPVQSYFSVGEVVKVDLRNGENFAGTAYPYEPDRLKRAELISNQVRIPVAGRLGDYPALQVKVSDPGLHLIRLDTQSRVLKYDSFDKFEEFLAEHALHAFAEKHSDRDLAKAQVSERYYRYCKLLFPVSSTSADSQHLPVALQAQGQRLELVPENDPFDADRLVLTLLLEGLPLADRQVVLHHRDKARHSRKVLAVSDENGQVSFDIALIGDYLINSVWLLEPLDGSVHWESLWASLVFER